MAARPAYRAAVAIHAVIPGRADRLVDQKIVEHRREEHLELSERINAADGQIAFDLTRLLPLNLIHARAEYAETNAEAGIEAGGAAPFDLLLNAETTWRPALTRVLFEGAGCGGITSVTVRVDPAATYTIRFHLVAGGAAA